MEDFGGNFKGITEQIDLEDYLICLNIYKKLCEMCDNINDVPLEKFQMLKVDNVKPEYDNCELDSVIITLKREINNEK